MSKININKGTNFSPDSKLREWGELFDNWHKVIEIYCEKTEGNDAPYSYNERANISLLCAAAWQSKWIALEEFQHSKKSLPGSKNDNYQGRCDLWIANDENDWFVEAKFKWISGNSKNFQNTAKLTIKSAIESARKTHLPGCRTAAISFFPIYIPINKGPENKRKTSEEEIYSAISNTIESAKEIKSADAVSWCFPTITRTMKSNINFLPGIIIIAQSLNRTRKK
jgi:hypothetical protein